MPSSYQVTPEVLGRRRATQRLLVRPVGRRSVQESARRQPENQPVGSDVTAQSANDSDSESVPSSALSGGATGHGDMLVAT